MTVPVFPPPDGSGQASNIAPDMAGTKELLNTICNPGQPPQETLNLSSTDVDDLVAFLKALTDERVRWEKAPFDHPSLTIPNGHVGDENKVKFNKATNQAAAANYRYCRRSELPDEKLKACRHSNLLIPDCNESAGVDKNSDCSLRLPAYLI